jgi:U3 small nucleolar RNA-associated protein 21
MRKRGPPVLIIQFFNFHNTALLHTLTLPSPITSITLNRASNLLLCICDDLTLRLVDIEARRIVREFRGFRGRILDACFSPDGRWVLATSLDGCVRTFDIPTGRLVDVFRTESVATSLSFSPTGDFLATAHVDSLAVHLWYVNLFFCCTMLFHENLHIYPLVCCVVQS